MLVTPKQLADLLVKRIQNVASATSAQKLGKLCGYNDSPIFGRRRARLRLLQETAIANIALCLQCTNKCIDAKFSSVLLPIFLEHTKNLLTAAFGSDTAQFMRRYQDQIPRYIEALDGSDPAIRAALVFSHALRLDIQKGVAKHLALVDYFERGINDLTVVLERMTVQDIYASHPAPANIDVQPEGLPFLDYYFEESKHWSKPASFNGMMALMAMSGGNDAEEFLKQLTPAQISVVMSAFRRSSKQAGA